MKEKQNHVNGVFQDEPKKGNTAWSHFIATHKQKF